MKKVKIIIERHPDGYVAYPLGLKGVVVGEGESREEARADVESAIRFHVETFGPEVFDEDLALELTRLAFLPNPRYSPPTRELTVYHAMKGKIWVDGNARRLAMIEGQLMEDVNFGWGLLGHLDKGGTFKVVQKNVGENHWDTVLLDLNMQGRAVIFKTLTVKQKQILSDFKRVRDDLSISQAYDLLQQKDRAVAAANPSGQ